MIDSVSIIIPTFNRVDSTIEAIKSALKQTHPPLEVIVIDDGSSSEISKLLEEKVSSLNDERIYLILADARRHPGIVRNIGVERSKGNWIAFLDSDDLWHPQKLEIQLGVLSKFGSEASDTGQGSTLIREINIDQLIVHQRKSTRKLLNENSIINSSVMVSREMLFKINKIASAYAVRGVEDYASWLRVSTLTKWITVENPLVIYKEDSTDSIRSDSNSKYSNYFGMTFAHLDYLAWRSTDFKFKIMGKLSKNAIRFLAKISS